MKTSNLFWLSAVVLAVCSASDSDARELGAHQHGHGTVNIAIDGKAMWIELEAPGADIVGFEHAAGSEPEKNILQKALADLENPFTSFELAKDAGCAVEAATVFLEGFDHHDGETEEHEEEVHGDDEAGSHGAFHAEYRFTCAAPNLIDEIIFTYFERFPRSQELKVNVIIGQSQKSYDVDRGTPRLRLGRL